MVAADAFAAQAGADVLRRGGNAVDAAVAALLVECVVQPHNIGLGGYAGSMVVCLGGRDKAVAIDFDSRAPAAATPDMFRADTCTDNWNIETAGDSGAPGVNEGGYLCVTAPPILAGLALALERFGTMPFSELAAPAELLASRGFPVYPQLARVLGMFAAHADPESAQALMPSGVVPKEGDLFVQSDLAALIARLRREGPMAFYSGEIPHAICGVVKRGGGILDPEDFLSVRPTIEEPLRVRCGDCEVLTPRPPSGGLTALQVLRAADLAGLSVADFGSPTYYHLLIEAARHAWSDRARFLGDPDFVNVPLDELLSERRTREVLEAIEAGAPPMEAPPDAVGAQHTVHLSVVDRQRNMVSLTASHGSWFGSMVALKGMGLVMGHGMSRFEFVPGRPNSIAPGKRMLHNMSPIVITRGDRPYCAIGLPGGRRIVNVSALLAHSIAGFGLTCGEAIDIPRFHIDNVLETGQVDSEPLAEAMRRQGHDVMLSSARIGGPVGGVMVAQETDHVLAASEAGPPCIRVL